MSEPVSPRLENTRPGRERWNIAGPGLIIVGSLLLLVSVGCFVVHNRNNRYLMRATAFIFDGPGDDETKAKELAHFVALHAAEIVNPDSASMVAKFEHHLPFEVSPATVLAEGFAFPDAHRFGPCGQLSRTIRAVACLHHIPSHKVLMGRGSNEHAMVALYVNGAYRLFDPTYDFYWTDSTGHVASVDLVRSDTAIFAQVYRKVPDYKFSLKDATYFRWARLGRLGKWIKSALTLVMGEVWVENIDTPQLYERPWWGYAWASLIVAVVCLSLGLARTRHVAYRSSRPVTEVGPPPRRVAAM